MSDNEPFPGSPDDFINTIAALRARVAKLEAALKPFADYADAIPYIRNFDGELGEVIVSGLRMSIRYEHLRQARAALRH